MARRKSQKQKREERAKLSGQMNEVPGTSGAHSFDIKSCESFSTDCAECDKFEHKPTEHSMMNLFAQLVPYSYNASYYPVMTLVSHFPCHLPAPIQFSNGLQNPPAPEVRAVPPTETAYMRNDSLGLFESSRYEVADPYDGSTQLQNSHQVFELSSEVSVGDIEYQHSQESLQPESQCESDISFSSMQEEDDYKLEIETSISEQNDLTESSVNLSFSDSEQEPLVENNKSLADIVLPNTFDDMARKKAGPRKDKARSASKRQRAKEASEIHARGLISRVGPNTSVKKPAAAGAFLTAAAARIVPGEGVLQYATAKDAPSNKHTSPNEDNGEEGFIAFDEDESDTPMDTGLASQFAQYEEDNEKQQEEEVEKFDKTARPVPEAPAPWLRYLPSGSTQETSLVEQITNEINAFTEFVSPTAKEQSKRESLVKRIQGLARRMWPGAKASLFGSFATGMYLPGADVDLVINTPERRLDNRREMYRLGERIKRQGWADSLDVIARARVPIVKFVDKNTGLAADISFERPSALAAVRTTQDWLRKEPAIKPLALVVKQLLKRKKLNEVVHGGLGGYATVCLIAHLLFTHPRLKSGEMRTTANLGVLVLEFFMYYGQEFDSRRLALVMTGEMGLVPKSSNVNLQTSIVDGLAIQDPNDPNNNVSRASFNWPQVRRAFVQAADLLRRQCAEYVDASLVAKSHHSFLAPVLMYNESRPQHPRLPVIPKGQTGRPDTSRKPPPPLKRGKQGQDQQKSGPPPLVKRLRLDPYIAVESSSSSDGEGEAKAGRGAKASSLATDSSADDDQDSRTFVTTAQRRQFWQNKGRTLASGTSS